MKAGFLPHTPHPFVPVRLPGLRFRFLPLCSPLFLRGLGGQGFLAADAGGFAGFRAETREQRRAARLSRAPRRGRTRAGSAAAGTPRRRGCF